MPVIIKANRDGFRRCGMAHSDQWTEHPDGVFTPEQLEALQADSMLQVKVTKAEPKAKGEAAAPAADPEAEPKAKAEAASAKKGK